MNGKQRAGKGFLFLVCMFHTEVVDSVCLQQQGLCNYPEGAANQAFVFWCIFLFFCFFLFMSPLIYTHTYAEYRTQSDMFCEKKIRGLLESVIATYNTFYTL